MKLKTHCTETEN